MSYPRRMIAEPCPDGAIGIFTCWDIIVSNEFLKVLSSVISLERERYRLGLF